VGRDSAARGVNHKIGTELVHIPLFILIADGDDHPAIRGWDQLNDTRARANAHVRLLLEPQPADALNHWAG
jgi:hypothetical protein